MKRQIGKVAARCCRRAPSHTEFTRDVPLSQTTSTHQRGSRQALQLSINMSLRKYQREQTDAPPEITDFASCPVEAPAFGGCSEKFAPADLAVLRTTGKSSSCAAELLVRLDTFERGPVEQNAAPCSLLLVDSQDAPPSVRAVSIRGEEEERVVGFQVDFATRLRPHGWPQKKRVYSG